MEATDRDELLINSLRRLLAMAERGQLRGVVFAGETAEGSIITGALGTYIMNPKAALGILSLLETKLTAEAKFGESRWSIL